MGVEDALTHVSALRRYALAHLPAIVHRLRERPSDAVRVAELQAKRMQLLGLHREADPGPVPADLAAAMQNLQRAATQAAASRHASRDPRRPGGPAANSGWTRAASMAAASLLLATVGAAAGWWGAQRVGPNAALALVQPVREAPSMGFARDAALAHVAFTPEKRHPVEVTVAEEAHLITWLSRRLGQPLKAPNLQPQGFALLGGRLLPGDASPRAQFMYENPSGQRITLYVTVFSEADRPSETSFRSMRRDGIETFYWIEERFGYALTGDLGKDEVLGLAREVYRQLGP